jgi:hypothetical protein
LKKTKQRPQAPRGGQPSLRLPAAPVAGGTFSPSTSEKPDNGAGRCGDPENVGRIGNPRLEEGMFLYLVSVALVAAATIVLLSLASISLLDTSKETFTGSRIDNSPIEEKFIGTVVSYTDSNVAPVPVQTKSPNSSEANNLASSTPVPLPSGMPREETVAEPAFNLPRGEHRSSRDPSRLDAGYVHRRDAAARAKWVARGDSFASVDRGRCEHRSARFGSNNADAGNF